MRIASNVGIHCLSVNKYEKYIMSTFFREHLSVYFKKKKKKSRRKWKSLVLCNDRFLMCMKDWKG